MKDHIAISDYRISDNLLDTKQEKSYNVTSFEKHSGTIIPVEDN
jgi:hypothetical protein